MGLLDVKDLCVTYPDATRPAVSGVNFSISSGESLGLVGESGSGKTQTALAMLGLLPANARTGGSIKFGDTELRGARTAVLNQFRAKRIAMVFQDPQAALNPYVRVGLQLQRILKEHKVCAGNESRLRTLDMLSRVGLADPERQFRAFPHQLSGGMRQRVMIGAALLAEPDLLIADEPTTALDVTVQVQILKLLANIREESNTALLLITHDLGIVAGHCERMLVMDQGRIIEEGNTTEIFSAPGSEKMQALLAVAPRLDREQGPDAPSAAADVVLDAQKIAVAYYERRMGGTKRLHAVRPTDFVLRRGETLAIVGESGSGKTSLVRAIAGLIPISTGRVAVHGTALAAAVGARDRKQHRDLQMVFQDPLASLNPAMRVEEIIAEPLHVHALECGNEVAAVKAMLGRVGISDRLLRRFPHELSGGQAQRVAIARSLILNPEVLICDEAVAALDGTVQDEILKLLRAEQAKSGLAIIFITHDIAVVQQIAHRIAVMYLGRLCEVAANVALFARPRHPYTKALLSAVPVPDPAAQHAVAPLPGEIASILEPPTGCPFHPRCEHAIAMCSEHLPELKDADGGRIACHRSSELDLSY